MTRGFDPEGKTDSAYEPQQQTYAGEDRLPGSTLNSSGPPRTEVAIRHVLVVDDSDSTRKMVCKLLDLTKQFLCEQAENGGVAVEMVRQRMLTQQQQQQQSFSGTTMTEHLSAPSVLNNMYDMIMVDYQMPEMDGPTAIAEIRRLGFRGIILGLTGNAMKKDQEVMIEAGADSVLTKPLSMQSFWVSLREASERRVS